MAKGLHRGSPLKLRTHRYDLSPAGLGLLVLLTFQDLQHPLENIAHVNAVGKVQLFHVYFQDGAVVKTELNHVCPIGLIPMVQVIDLRELPAAFDLHFSAALLDSLPGQGRAYLQEDDQIRGGKLPVNGLKLSDQVIQLVLGQ